MVLLGKNIRTGGTVQLSSAARQQGTYCLGINGSGKSNLILQVALEDMQNGDGVCVLDPHGDLIDELLVRIPKSRLDDTILFDPSEQTRPFGLNLLDCPDPTDPAVVERVTSEAVLAFKKMFQSSWGPRLEDILRKAVLTLILTTPGASLLDLLLFITRDAHRARYISNCHDRFLLDYWTNQFPDEKKTRSDWSSPLINKLGRFLSNPLIRNIVCQPRSTIDLRKVMDDGQILLVNLSKGRLGEENSSLLGSTIVGKFLIAALSRTEVPVAERRPFHLIVDEYHGFATESFPTLQSEARKFGIDTLVAHQYRGQLDQLNQGSTLNVGNFVMFRLTGRDAREMAMQFDNSPPEAHPEYRAFTVESGRPGIYRQGPDMLQLPGRPRSYGDVENETANQLVNSPNWQAYCKIIEGRELVDYCIETIAASARFPADSTNVKRIKDRAQQFGTPRDEVEQRFNEAWGPANPATFDRGDSGSPSPTITRQR